MTAQQTRRLHQSATHILTAHLYALEVRHTLPVDHIFRDEFATFASHMRQAEAALTRVLHDEQIDPSDETPTHTHKGGKP